MSSELFIHHYVISSLTGVLWTSLQRARRSFVMPPPPYDLENLVNAIANPIFVKDRENRWVLLNDACCELIGVERSKLIGKSDYEFFPKDQADVFWKKDEQVF